MVRDIPRRRACRARPSGPRTAGRRRAARPAPCRPRRPKSSRNTAAGSQPSHLLEAGVPRIAQDDVIHQIDSHQHARRCQPPCQLHIVWARAGIAGRMIVEGDDRGRRAECRFAKYIARLHHRRVQRADGQRPWSSARGISCRAGRARTVRPAGCRRPASDTPPCRAASAAAPASAARASVSAGPVRPRPAAARLWRGRFPMRAPDPRRLIVTTRARRRGRPGVHWRPPECPVAGVRFPARGLPIRCRPAPRRRAPGAFPLDDR